MTRLLLPTLSGLLIASALSAADGKLPAAATGTIEFGRDVEPILAKNCVKCHGAEKQKGGLRLDRETDARAGGNSGPVIQPGAKAAESRLLQVIAGLDPDVKMPPQGPALSSDDVGKLRAWIEQGAKWSAAGQSVAEGERTPVQSSHWAFQPIRRPAVPTLARAAGSHNPLDAFIRAKLETENVAPSPEADRPTLIRRLSLDLRGLPPSPAEVDAFLQDTAPDAYNRLVDRMLASPRYGERWARHWLDLARYADSDGFEKDTGRPWAWRYREWVINALNRNQPFDQFTIDQIAGDLLPDATAEQKIATGFHRNTLTNKEGGVDPEQYRVEQVVDRVNTTGKAFLGITIGCCQCHDHKYDPFSQREYFQFFAFFNSDREVDMEAPLPGEEGPYQTAKAAHAKKRVGLKRAVDEHKGKLPKLQEEWEAGLALPQLRTLPSNIQTTLLKETQARTPKETTDLAAYFAKQDKTMARLTKALTDHDRQAPTLSKAPTLALGQSRQTHVMVRGDFLRPGAAVTANTPAVLQPLGTKSPNRLDLARWIVAADNPLTARVYVNWVWQKFFGRGLVATLDDFGTQGEKPSHPELLDWLAGEFVRSGWDVKRLHRLIVTSATYRQSSATRPDLRDRDPTNIWLARQSRLRLEAEGVRDASLAASGLLAPRIGGPSVRPPQPAGISELTYANSAKWVESTGADRYRRGLYTWFQRTSPHPMLMTFDAPDSNVSCVRRERSNTPLQALTLLNDTTFVECAQSLGRHLAAETGTSVGDRIRVAFRCCLSRAPTPAEAERLERLYDEFRSLGRAKPEEAAKLAGQTLEGSDAADAAAWVALARTLLNLDEFVTRE
jgi:mono/diheme cytochrome c family protein